MYCHWDERKTTVLRKHKRMAPPPNCMSKIMIALLCSQSKRSQRTWLVTGSSGNAKWHVNGRRVTSWAVMCHTMGRRVLPELVVCNSAFCGQQDEDTTSKNTVKVKCRLSRWHCNKSMGCIKREGLSYRGFHRGVFILGRNYKGPDAFSRIMSL